MNILQMSFYGTVLILIITALRTVIKNKLPKKTFMVLWGIVMLRLLIPYSLPSAFSVYSWINTETSADGETPLENYSFDLGQKSFEERPAEEKGISDSADTVGSAVSNAQVKPSAITAAAETAADHDTPLSENGFLTVIWLSGAALLGIFFTVAYIRCNFEFKTSLPLENEFIGQWLEEHKIKRRVSVRRSDKITAPLTYGFFRPVILIPKNTDLENTKQLEYVLLHEYVHICRFDSVLKLVCVFTLCLHWFNPAVWLMYFLFNRDIELACDESTVKKTGLDSKAEYARMLIALEEKKAGITPLCSGFGKNSVKERILSVMKMKKFSVFAVVGAVVITAAVAAVFATSAKPVSNENNEKYENTESVGGEMKINLSDNREPIFSESDFEKMLALKFDNLEQMSIAEFQDKVWKITDTDEYRELFERFSRYEPRFDTERNERADFIFNTLFPLTRERWQRTTFSGSFINTDSPSLSGFIRVEYNVNYTICDPESVTVGEYMTARTNIPKGLEEALDGTTFKYYINDELIKEALTEAAKEMTKLYGSKNFDITMDIFMTHEYMNLTPAEILKEPEEEPRVFPNASQSDYDSLLKLKTPDYRNMSLNDFNAAVLEWTNEDYERSERVNTDISHNDFTADLSKTEKSFVTLTFDLSQTENGEIIRSNYTGNPEEDPSLYFQFTTKTAERNGAAAWCDLYCGFSYHTENKETVTVGERDDRVGGMINEINEFWDYTDIEVLLKMTKEDFLNKLTEMAEKYSGGGITIAVPEDVVGVECMDERGVEAAAYENHADPELYGEYSVYGLTVNPDDMKLYYDGKLVRCFDDRYSTGLFGVKAVGYCEKSGVIDVRAVRENEKLIGLEILSEEEFRNREIEGAANADNSAPANSESIFDPYAEYGLEYNEEENALLYGGERVRLFWDSLSADFQPSASESPFAVSVSNWDEKGSVDLYVVRDHKRRDSNGYGMITGFRIADNEEFERNTEIFGGMGEFAEYA